MDNPCHASKTNRELFVVLTMHGKAILEWRAADQTGLFVFPGRQKGHMAAPQHGWACICTRAGITDLHKNILRRSLASFQIDAGTPLEVIQ